MPTHFPKNRLRGIQLPAIVLALLPFVITSTTAQAESARLIDQPPFDRITLKAEAGGEVIDTLLLDLPNRYLPSPLPTEGEVELRRVIEPSVLYTISWASIAKIELYEQLVLDETQRLIEAKKFPEAFAYLEFINKQYPDLNGLSLTTEKYLKQDAFHSFSEKRYDDSIAILTALYDLNPNHNGLASAIDTIIDRIVKSHLATRDYTSARVILDSANDAFPKLNLSSVTSWRKKFKSGANRQLQLANQHLVNSDYHEARIAIRRAAAILPSAPLIQEMLAEVNRLSPQVIVGVTQHGSTSLRNPLSDMATLRLSRLTKPQFVEMTDFDSEGGNYSSKWADFSTDDSGLEYSIQLNSNASEAEIWPSTLVMQILQLTYPSNPSYQPTLSGLLKNISIHDGQRIQLQWHHPHVRPEALLPLSLQDISASNTLPGAYMPVANRVEKNLLQFEPLEQPENGSKLPSLLERVFSSEELALTALLQGDIDVLERIAPWQIDRLRNVKKITISKYRLPTIHALIPNYSKPLLRRREFRRALCYGINRQQIVNEIILGGKLQNGFQVLSGPLPAGTSITDPLGYGYKQEILPRPYEPRLAAVLAAVADASLKPHEKTKASENLSSGTPQPEEERDEDETEVESLVLAYPPNFVAQAACQSIKRQLESVGIPIKLKKLSPYSTRSSEDYDLRYAELAIWEPLTDMQYLLGPQGIAGHCSPTMSLALNAVDQARNWQEARTRLRVIHDIAFADLPIVPLWQTINYFAYNNSLQGVSDAPISLYQDVDRWKISGIGAE